MAELKTRPGKEDVTTFIQSIEPEQRRTDCEQLLKLMKKATGAKPVLWGGSIVGFGEYHYKYKTGREGDWFLTGFASRKQDLTIYIMTGFDRYPELMAKLGKYKTGSSCLYLKRLTDIDINVLEELLQASTERLKSGQRC